MSKQEKIPLKKAFSFIFFSLVCSSFIFYISLLSYTYLEEKQEVNPDFNIEAIEEIGSRKESLSVQYLAELLNLSVDKKDNLYLFSTEEAKKKLLASPVIEQVFVQKIFPHTLRVEYTVRTPLFIFGNYTNTLIDKQGVLFPERPFYTPKNLPVFLCNGAEIREPPFYGVSLSSNSFDLAKKCYKVLTKEWNLKPFQIKKIDTTDAFNKNLGKQGIIIVIEEKKQGSHTLRLPTYQWESQLSLYFCLKNIQKKVTDPSCNFPVFDLRLKDLCLIKT